MISIKNVPMHFLVQKRSVITKPRRFINIFYGQNKKSVHAQFWGVQCGQYIIAVSRCVSAFGILLGFRRKGFLYYWGRRTGDWCFHCFHFDTFLMEMKNCWSLTFTQSTKGESQMSSLSTAQLCHAYCLLKSDTPSLSDLLSV